MGHAISSIEILAQPMPPEAAGPNRALGAPALRARNGRPRSIRAQLPLVHASACSQVEWLARSTPGASGIAPGTAAANRDLPQTELGTRDTRRTIPGWHGDGYGAAQCRQHPDRRGAANAARPRPRRWTAPRTRASGIGGWYLPARSRARGQRAPFRSPIRAAPTRRSRSPAPPRAR
jgi:hypothetical protein